MSRGFKHTEEAKRKISRVHKFSFRPKRKKESLPDLEKFSAAKKMISQTATISKMPGSSTSGKPKYRDGRRNNGGARPNSGSKPNKALNGYRPGSGQKPTKALRRARKSYRARDLFNKAVDEKWKLMLKEVQNWCAGSNKNFVWKIIEQRIGRAPQYMAIDQQGQYDITINLNDEVLRKAIKYAEEVGPLQPT